MGPRQERLLARLAVRLTTPNLSGAGGVHPFVCPRQPAGCTSRGRQSVWSALAASPFAESSRRCRPLWRGSGSVGEGNLVGPDLECSPFTSAMHHSATSALAASARSLSQVCQTRGDRRRENPLREGTCCPDTGEATKGRGCAFHCAAIDGLTGNGTVSSSGTMRVLRHMPWTAHRDRQVYNRW